MSLNDQMRLLQSSWSEILTLTLVFRSLPRTGRLHFASDFSVSASQANECGLEEFYDHVSYSLSRKMKGAKCETGRVHFFSALWPWSDWSGSGCARRSSSSSRPSSSPTATCGSTSTPPSGGCGTTYSLHSTTAWPFYGKIGISGRARFPGLLKTIFFIFLLQVRQPGDPRAEHDADLALHPAGRRARPQVLAANSN